MVERQITIKTLNGEQKMKSILMSGLKVWSDRDEDNKRWLDLPATYTKEASSRCRVGYYKRENWNLGSPEEDCEQST